MLSVISNKKRGTIAPLFNYLEICQIVGNFQGSR